MRLTKEQRAENEKLRTRIELDIARELFKVGCWHYVTTERIRQVTLALVRRPDFSRFLFQFDRVKRAHE